MKHIRKLLLASLALSFILPATCQPVCAAQTGSYGIFADAYADMPKTVFSNYEYRWADFQKAGDPGISNGVLAGKISDFDNDGNTELLVLKIKKYTGTAQDNYTDPFSNTVVTPYYLAYMEMYEAENGRPVLADTTRSFDAFDNMSEGGGVECFTKGSYIVLQTASQNNVFGDGCMHQISIYEYSNRKFVTKHEFNEGGSAWAPDTAAEFARDFEKIGFDGTVNYLNSTSYAGFSDTGFNLAKLEKNTEGIFEMLISNNRNEVDQSAEYRNSYDSSQVYLRNERMKISVNNFTDIKVPDIKVLLNGKELSFEQPPYIKNGTALVPMRAVFEAMDAAVDWNGETQTITAKKDDITIILTLNTSTAVVNGRIISLAAPAELTNGFAMVPLRFVSESLGADVNWDNSTRTISISD